MVRWPGAVGRSVDIGAATSRDRHLTRPAVKGISSTCSGVASPVRTHRASERRKRFTGVIRIEKKDQVRRTSFAGGHLKTCRSINDAAEGLKEVSKFMQNGPIAGIDGWYICLLGTLLSLLFIMNGVILLLYGIRQKME